MRRPFAWIALAALLAIIVGLAFVSASCRPAGPHRIGVLLPLSGPRDRDLDEVLKWAVAELDAKGGIGGRRVELVFRDTAGRDVRQLAQGLIDDPAIQIVIGPETSAEVYEIAPMFIRNSKLLISPSSTAGDVLRAFGKKRFFWRTCQSDVAQVRMILRVLGSRKVGRFSLIYEDSVYGKTFSDWMGFFAIEREMELLEVVKLGKWQGDQTGAREQAGQLDVSAAVSGALAGDPQYVVCAVAPGEAVRIKRELDRLGGRAKLFLTDAAESKYLLDELGPAAEGLELVSPAADPDSGFETAYGKRFGYAPWDYAATTHDAFYLAVCALARNEQQAGRQGIEVSLADVVAGRGRRLAWDQTDDAVLAILKGELPDIAGASGSLGFDEEFGVDPLQTYYALDRVSKKNGVRDFRTVETVDSDTTLGYGDLKSGAAASRALASGGHSELDAPGRATYVPGARKDLWAVVVAASAGWEDYRHQADALAVYDLLKHNGVNDDRIMLFSVDDVPGDDRNRPKGSVHNVVGGKDLRKGAVIDYAGGDVAVRNLEDVLLGDKTAGAPTVLESDQHSNVLLYIVDHGEPGRVLFEKDFRDGALGADRLARIVGTMRARKRYRQMLIVTEVCYGEGMALDIGSPGVVCLTGAAMNERSFATNYDDGIGAWLADDFTFQTLGIVAKDPDVSIAELYERVYPRVAGSHVRLKNQRDFGDVYGTSIKEFVAP